MFWFSFFHSCIVKKSCFVRRWGIFSAFTVKCLTFAGGTTPFLISNTFISNARLKLANPEAELLPFENYLLFYQRYHSKIIRDIIKNVQKTSTSV